jgi:V8-like Glu-specific endopeptidase
MPLWTRSTTMYCLLIAVVAIPVLANGQTLEERREKILAHDMRIEQLESLRQITSAGITVPTAPQPVSAIRVHLRLVDGGTSAWAVVVADSSGVEMSRVTAADFFEGEFWIPDIPGGSAQLRLTPSQANARIAVDAYAVPITPDVPQALVGPDDSLFITDDAVPPRVKPWARAIARLRFMTATGGAFCSGFLVGPDLLLTNQHCISNPAEAASARVEFGFDSGGATPVTFGVTKIEAVDPRLDYSLLRLRGNAATQFGRLFLGSAVLSQMPLFLVQHPQGLPKKVAFPPNCAVGSTSVAGVDDVLNDFGHVCDTLGGSSGSPVMEATDGTVVGLHHWRWPAGAERPENQAVHITLIVKDLTARVEKNTLQQAVLDEVTSPRPQ